MAALLLGPLEANLGMVACALGWQLPGYSAMLFGRTTVEADTLEMSVESKL